MDAVGPVLVLEVFDDDPVGDEQDTGTATEAIPRDQALHWAWAVGVLDEWADASAAVELEADADGSTVQDHGRLRGPSSRPQQLALALGALAGQRGAEFGVADDDLESPCLALAPLARVDSLLALVFAQLEHATLAAQFDDVRVEASGAVASQRQAASGLEPRAGFAPHRGREHSVEEPA